MGIQGLLPLLSPIIRSQHLSSYKNKKAGIDAYSWLHKACHYFAAELCNQKSGEFSNLFLGHVMQRVELLTKNNVIPVFVFDGANHVGKKDTENVRQKNRDENLKLARECKEKTKALEYYQKALDITPQIAFTLISHLKKNNVSFVVAPFEADAQLAYMSINNLVDVVITEDSDLLPFGCRRVFYKMDYTGYGQEISYDDIFSHPMSPFYQWNHMNFLKTCILSGCDYLKSINGIGLKTAQKLVKEYNTIERILNNIRFVGKYSIPVGYRNSFELALESFLYQRVYDPITNTLVYLNSLPSALVLNINDHLGANFSNEIASGIAMGILDPTTLEAYKLVPEEEISVPKCDYESVQLIRSSKQSIYHSIKDFFPPKDLNITYVAKKVDEIKFVSFPKVSPLKRRATENSKYFFPGSATNNLDETSINKELETKEISDSSIENFEHFRRKCPVKRTSSLPSKLISHVELDTEESMEFLHQDFLSKYIYRK